MIVILGLLFLMGSVWSAYALKVKFSGGNLNHVKLYFCLIFNGFFVITYMDVIKYDDFLYLGYRPDITVGYPIIDWIALIGMLAHAFALPMKWKVKRWFLNDKKEGD
ncbi:hypothetical protein [Pseudomonas sp. I8001]|uniref:hypothetical protein n=1 Tax=Pseudomonas sp. I8001 TaxID=2738825 RepID=UPI0015A0B76A|nr:hypothetical protein [Pseudomonas sp. I8001]NWB67838.1 hypothetical protein [Pseudomonas sp. I8001]